MSIKRIIAGALASFTVMSFAGCEDADENDPISKNNGTSSSQTDTTRTTSRIQTTTEETTTEPKTEPETTSEAKTTTEEKTTEPETKAGSKIKLNYEQIGYDSPEELLEAYTNLPFEFFDLKEGDGVTASYKALRKLAKKVEQMIYLPECEVTLQMLCDRSDEANEDTVEEEMLDHFAEGIGDFLTEVESYEGDGTDFDKWYFDYGTPSKITADEIKKRIEDGDDTSGNLQYYLDLGFEGSVMYDVWYRDPAGENAVSCPLQDDLACVCFNGKWYLSAENLIMG